MEYYNSEDRAPVRWGLIAVAIYFVTLGVLMLTIGFSVESSDPTTAGIMVEFGESEDGVGEEELLATDVAATPPAPQEPQREEPIEVDERQDIAVEQQEVISKTTPQTPQKEQVVEQPDTVVLEERVVNQNALFPGRKEQSTATSQGSTQGAGNQGAASGGESGAAVGGGDGNEPTFELKNRSVVGQLPKPDYGANVSGRVIIDITVDQTGRVKSATYRAQGSTTNNSQLVEAAQAAALKARFTPSDEFIQGGTITYIFKMN
ncbi:MAG: TonB family protein [Rikenellaceae bacterium]